MCACDRKYPKRKYYGMSEFAVRKRMRMISLGFGSSSEAVVTRLIDWTANIMFRFSKTKHLCSNTMQSLSLSPFTTCYQSCKQCGQRANKQTKSYNLVLLCVWWSPHAERNISDKNLLSDGCLGRIKRGDRGSGPPWKITKI